MEHIVVYYGNAYIVKVFGYSGSDTPTNTLYWEQANKYNFVAMDTALIDGANIAGFMYKNQKMQSSSTSGGYPNLLLDGNAGEIEVRGNGRLYLRANSGNYFSFNPSFASLKFYNSSGSELIDLGMGDSASWIKLKNGSNSSFLTGSILTLENSSGQSVTIGNNSISIKSGTNNVIVTNNSVTVTNGSNTARVSPNELYVMDSSNNIARLTSTELYFTKTGNSYK